MDPTNPAQPNPSLRPMNEPHTPISEAEMNSNMHNEKPTSGRSTLLTLASLLVLVGIVGVTLYLYIQNKSSLKLPNLNNEIKDQIADKVPTPTPNFEKKPEQLLQDHGVVCRRFTSLEEALADPEIACVVDLSGQKLTTIPQDLLKLKNLTELNLSNNDLTEFPSELFKLKKLITIDLSKNRIQSTELSKVGSDIIPQYLQEIDLSENLLSNQSKIQLKESFGEVVNLIL